MKTLPGHGYFARLNSFFASHCEIGDLYLEFRKNSCINKIGRQCKFCEKYPPIDDRVGPVPRPYPNHDLLPVFKYHDGPNTPFYKADGSVRDIDDFNPRVQIRTLFESGQLNSANTNAVKEASKKLIIGEDLVRKRVEHLEYLKLKKTKRAEVKKSRREVEDRKTYKDYDWINLYRTN